MTNNNNVFGNFGGTAVGEPEVDRWQYPTLGYNASEGIFYVDEDKVVTLTLVPLALRQCKEMADLSGVIHRYPVKTPKSQMVDGDLTNRLQVVCIHDGELHVFGARSWTARASWLNPRGGQWRDDNFETGVWYQLEDYIKEMKSKHGVATTPLCWEITLSASGKQITVGTGRNTSKSHPITMEGVPVFVGPERVAEYEDLFISEDLTAWVNEWKKLTTETAAVEDVQPIEEDLPDGIPF